MRDSMEKRTIRTTELPPSLHRNFARTSLFNLKGIPGYSKAKYDGDVQAAYEVVKKVMCNEAGRERMLELFSWLETNEPVCIVPVIGSERKWSVNALPIAYAKILAEYYREFSSSRPQSQTILSRSAVRTPDWGIRYALATRSHMMEKYRIGTCNTS